MPLTVVPNLLLLPFESARLGRFIKNINHPLEGYYEPFPSTAPTPIVSQFEYASYS
jgi:hypothetical protein